jgi:hypothetical protein
VDAHRFDIEFEHSSVDGRDGSGGGKLDGPHRRYLWISDDGTRLTPGYEKAVGLVRAVDITFADQRGTCLQNGFGESGAGLAHNRDGGIEHL